MLSQRAKLMKPSPTLALNARAKKMTAEGHNVLALSVGEPDWNSFDLVIDTAVSALKEGMTKYSPSNGLPDLRKVIAEDLSQFLKIPYTPEQVTVTAGAKFSIFAAMQALIDQNDEVIIPAPYWVSYPTMVELAGGTPVIATCDHTVNFKLTPAILEKLINVKTKMLILNSPSNPTGLMYSSAELKAIGSLLEKHPQVVILTDDIYNQLVFEGGGKAPHILQVCPQLQDRTLMIDGASKAYSMTGWRVGWATGPKVIVDAMTNYQSQSVSCAASFSQWATIPAVTKLKNEVKASVQNLKDRRDYFADKLKAISGLDVFLPDGTFYFWIGIKSLLGKSFQGTKLENSSQFCELLLNQEKLVVVPGNEFGLDGYLRLSFAIPKNRLEEAAIRLDRFVKALQ
ncbi:MAG: pyridoxal phosphate-dependent aminotransferase [Bdellovibrionales bacterium]|nr:pyridoxal phosphate-dependent aminotransferase [Bdellovibrionales bacterium]